LPELLPILLGALFPLAAAWSLGRACLPGLPHTLGFAIGAALLSQVVFAMLAAGIAGRATFAVAGGLALLPAMWRLARRRPSTARILRWPNERLAAALLAPYAVLYLVHALAPETQPDGYTYHLGLVGEWIRNGGFPDRVGFYEMLPQGMEMLFAFAFAFGGHSAAKLAHFAFLALTVPLLFDTARRLGLERRVAGAAAVFYVCSPVVGTYATASYNDAALVFYILATVDLLLAWAGSDDKRHLLAAGIAAGFCYAIKFTGGMAAPLAAVYAGRRRGWKAGLAAGAGAAAMILPWVLRNLLMTGNPVAPLFNRLFPNPYFHVSSEQTLAAYLRSYGDVTWARAPLELALFGQALQGLVGPLFLLAPVGLLALRHRAGRVVLALAMAAALPWGFNIGTRFLAPALVFLALLVAMSLPRRVAAACMVFHAISCWPAVVELYADAGAWRLRGFPWRAALRVEPESVYLERELPEYAVARLVEANIAAGERFLSLGASPGAYFRATAVSPWQSAEAGRLADALETAVVADRGMLYELRARWPEQHLAAVRFELREGHAFEKWSVHEVELERDGQRIVPRRGWRVSARPNPWEAPLALDRNPVSRWRTWEPRRAGMYLEVEPGGRSRLGGALLVCYLPEQRRLKVAVLGLGADGVWRLLAQDMKAASRPSLNLRLSATRLLRRSGIRYVLTPIGNEGLARTGRDLVDHPGDWGMEVVGNAGSVYLLRLR